MATDLARALWSLRTAASIEELARRYRRLCKLFHPDIQPLEQRVHFERMMQQINDAYSAALEKFNIFTYRNPHQPDQPGKAVHEDLLYDTPPADKPGWSQSAAQAPRQKPAAPEPGFGVVFASTEAARALGRALAILQDARTFFSFKAANSPAESEALSKALPVLEDLHRRFPSLKEGQDALYYIAIIHCGLRDFKEALRCFNYFRRIYPQDERLPVLHFYMGLCHHRLESYAVAALEYGLFLTSNPGGHYHHFLALVATYLDAARQETIPPALPYG